MLHRFYYVTPHLKNYIYVIKAVKVVLEQFTWAKQSRKCKNSLFTANIDVSQSYLGPNGVIYVTFTTTPCKNH